MSAFTPGAFFGCASPGGRPVPLFPSTSVPNVSTPTAARTVDAQHHRLSERRRHRGRQRQAGRGRRHGCRSGWARCPVGDEAVADRRPTPCKRRAETGEKIVNLRQSSSRRRRRSIRVRTTNLESVRERGCRRPKWSRRGWRRGEAPRRRRRDGASIVAPPEHDVVPGASSAPPNRIGGLDAGGTTPYEWPDGARRRRRGKAHGRRAPPSGANLRPVQGRQEARGPPVAPRRRPSILSSRRGDTSADYFHALLFEYASTSRRREALISVLELEREDEDDGDQRGNDHREDGDQAESPTASARRPARGGHISTARLGGGELGAFRRQNVAHVGGRAADDGDVVVGLRVAVVATSRGARTSPSPTTSSTCTGCSPGTARRTRRSSSPWRSRGAHLGRTHRAGCARRRPWRDRPRRRIAGAARRRRRRGTGRRRRRRRRQRRRRRRGGWGGRWRRRRGTALWPP